jgi:hypothetical protein
MTVKSVFFNGRLITHPGAYSKVDASGMVAKSVGIGKISAFIGSALGGQPGEILWFDDPYKAKKVLIGGDLLKAAEKAWAPTPEGGGADLIALIRANPATKAYLTLNDGKPAVASIVAPQGSVANTSTGAVTATGSYVGTVDGDFTVLIDSAGTKAKATATFKWRKGSGAWTTGVACATDQILAEGVTVSFGAGNYVENDTWSVVVICNKAYTECALASSKDWGLRNNNVKVKIQDGNIAGTKKWSTYNVLLGTYEVFDDIGKMFTVTYSGMEAYVALIVEASVSDGKAITIKTKKGADAGSAVDDIVIDLSVQMYSSLTQVMDEINSHANYLCKPVSGVIYSNYSSRELDVATYTAIKTETLITAVKADLAKTVTAKSELIDLAVTNWSAGIPDNMEYTILSGGTEGVIPTSWVAYFDKLSGLDITSIVPLTSDPSIQAEGLAHVNYASDVLRRERNLVVGGAPGETKQQIKDRALRLNSSRVQVAYPGFYDYAGVEEVLYPSYITAAMYAGRQNFKDWGESCTFDFFSMVRPEFEIQPDDINDLLNAGVAPLEVVLGEGVRLVQDITSYNSDTNALYVERSVGEVADYLSRKIRKAVEKTFVGKKGLKGQVTSIKNTAVGVLTEETDKTITAFRNVRVTLSDRVATLEYEAAPVEPTNFILITSHFYIDAFSV